MAEKKTILLRLSPQMWDDISKWAEDEFRSINGQIEYILHDALKKCGRLRSAPQGDCNGSGRNEPKGQL